MNKKQWNAFCEYKNKLKKYCDEWTQKFGNELLPLQKMASINDTPEYPLENPVVYNTAYDDITENDEIKLIVIGDNPGKEEQLSCNKKYLVGQSGRIADGFFKRNPELEIDFRKNVIIMNKTPVHTAKTAHLKYLIRNGGDGIRNLIEESQIKMAELAFNLQKILNEDSTDYRTQLWLVGYAELKNKGLFLSYRDVLKNLYFGTELWNDLYVYQHFSMNRFIVDLKKFRETYEEESVKSSLQILGHQHRDEIFLY